VNRDEDEALRGEALAPLRDLLGRVVTDIAVHRPELHQHRLAAQFRFARLSPLIQVSRLASDGSGLRMRRPIVRPSGDAQPLLARQE
jgi:hypothetical protein